MKKIKYLFFILIIWNNAISQSGSNSSFQFLNLTTSARVNALGGYFIPYNDNDISSILTNPSLLSSSVHNHLSLTMADYFTDIKMGSASYSRTFKKAGSFAANFQFINYGNFKHTDATGQILGDFSANENAIVIGWGRMLDSSFAIGSNLKTIFSNFEDNKSFGLAVDVATSYTSKNSYFSASLIAKNIGRQLKTFSGNESEPLPFELSTGVYLVLPKSPFRIVIQYNHLENFDLNYNDPDNPNVTIDPISGEMIEKSNFNITADKFLRHMVFGTEFIPFKFLNIQLGYNYQRRKELRVNTGSITFAGVSWGIGLKLKKFNLNYSHAKYHPANSPNYFTLSTNLENFISKKHK